MKKSSQVLIWDFDGTLAKRKGGWSGALWSVLKKSDPKTQVTAEQIRPFLQSGFPWHAPECAHPDLSADDWWLDLMVVFARAFRSVGVDPVQAKTLARKVRATYVDLSAWQLFEDTLPTLKTLSARGWQHVILSNHIPELPQILDHLALTSHFAVVFNSAQTGWEKPNGHAFRLVQDWIQKHATAGASAKTWVIGDNLSSDVRGASEAGLQAILVRGTAPDVLSCENLSGLLDILK